MPTRRHTISALLRRFYISVSAPGRKNKRDRAGCRCALQMLGVAAIRAWNPPPSPAKPASTPVINIIRRDRNGVDRYCRFGEKSHVYHVKDSHVPGTSLERLVLFPSRVRCHRWQLWRGERFGVRCYAEVLLNSCREFRWYKNIPFFRVYNFQAIISLWRFL